MVDASVRPFECPVLGVARPQELIMPLLEESRFLTELNKARAHAHAVVSCGTTLNPYRLPLTLAFQLYERHKASGTVWVTMKRSAWEWAGRGRCCLTEPATPRSHL